jgi:hypothetical protein
MKLSDLLNRWTVLGALGVTTALCIVFAMWAWVTQPPAPTAFSPLNAAVTIIPPPTATPTPLVSPTPDPSRVAPGDASGIVVNGYVQISGTEGEGLRLRSAPGLGGEQLFLGYDSEVFQVRDGPQTVDGYTWWYLVAPYDEGRAGWAAANYLAVIPPPQ